MEKEKRKGKRKHYKTYLLVYIHAKVIGCRNIHDLIIECKFEGKGNMSRCKDNILY